MKIICDRVKVYFDGKELVKGENDVDDKAPGFESLLKRPFISKPTRGRPAKKEADPKDAKE